MLQGGCRRREAAELRERASVETRSVYQLSTLRRLKDEVRQLKCHRRRVAGSGEARLDFERVRDLVGQLSAPRGRGVSEQRLHQACDPSTATMMGERTGHLNAFSSSKRYKSVRPEAHTPGLRLPYGGRCSADVHVCFTKFCAGLQTANSRRSICDSDRLLSCDAPIADSNFDLQM